ncbi:MAG TPA: DCC1-like thiol-disulfide oxidoreductase family protein [Marinilabiliaceae bacterium]|nr:DCC1-like thiol-disulfide oxidoreductase family protein [Marinilabiliaceae bacterium]
MPSTQENKNSSVLLFDGFCILCSGFARRLINRLGKQISVIPMQSEIGQKILENHHQSNLPNEVIFISDNQLIKGVKAVLILMEMSGGVRKLASKFLRLFPLKLLEWFYRQIARNRFIWFGRRDSCYMGNNSL